MDTPVIEVFCNLRGQRHYVGRLAERARSVYFEYDKNFLNNGPELSPFKLPLQPGVFEDKERVFDGLPGLFNDSLPGGWGVLLLDRTLKRSGLTLREISPLHRLSLVGKSGMGALEYEPEKTLGAELPAEGLKLDGLAHDARKILAADDSSLEVVNELFQLGGSSGGARPKILADVSADGRRIVPEGAGGEDFSPWLIKFHSREDGPDQGLVEYAYSIMARECGIDMPETRLFPSETTSGFFGVRRFDRDVRGKVHVHTASGLLHASHRLPALDYENLIRLTKALTRDVREVNKMVRLMVFNVVTGNRDDHAKNFSFLLDAKGMWKMTPAYDLTPSFGFGDEHSAMVSGKGKDITDKDLLTAASVADVSAAFVKEMIEQTRHVFAGFQSLVEKIRAGRFPS